MFETELEHGNRSDLDNLASNSRLWKPVSWPCPPRKWSSKLVSCRFGGGNVSMSRMCWRCILEADVAISGQIPTPSMLGPSVLCVCRTTYAYIQSLRLLHDRDKMLASPFDGVFLAGWPMRIEEHCQQPAVGWMFFVWKHLGLSRRRVCRSMPPAIVTCECLKII